MPPPSPCLPLFPPPVCYTFIMISTLHDIFFNNLLFFAEFILNILCAYEYA